MAPWPSTAGCKKRRRGWLQAAVAAVACLLPPARAASWSDSMADAMCARGSCMAQGATTCDRASESCPPCMYALAGGDVSCYNLDADGNCPYPDQVATCSSASSGDSSGAPASETESTTASTVSSAESSIGDPISQSRTPSTSAPITTDTAAATVSPGPANNSSTGSAGASASSDVGSSGDGFVTITASSSGSSSGSEGMYKSSGVTDAPSDVTGTSESVDATNGSASDANSSPLALNVSVLVGVAVVAVLVAVFVVRRVQRNRSRRLAAQAHDLASPYSVHGDGGHGLFALTTHDMNKSAASSVVLLGDSQVTSAGEIPTVCSMSSSLTRSTAEFQHFDSGTGPLFMPSVSPAKRGTGARSGGGDASHFVDLSASGGSVTTHASCSSDDIVSARRLPQAIGEGQEYTQFDAQHGPSPELPVAPGLVLGAKPYRPLDRRQEDLGASTGSGASGSSSQADDYDIVDPSTLRAVERRNTELLMRDGRFRPFSLASDADLDDSDSEAGGSSRRGRWPSLEDQEHWL